MATLTCRAFSNSAAFSYLNRSVQNFESNCLRIVTRLHSGRGLTAVPAPSITDAIATLADGDDVLAAQLFGGPLNPEIESEIADTVASTFSKTRGDLTPSEAQIAKIVGRSLASRAYSLLQLSDKIAITRTLAKDEARALCERRINSKRIAMRESVATL